jgi:branched-chain amino acid aminotransferase
MTNSIYEKGCAWIDGQFVPIDKAAIPITDTGFTRSDLTYDVVSVWNGKFFRLEDHLNRFERGWNRIRMHPQMSRSEMEQVVFECVAKSGLREAYVEMIITRGIPLDGDRDPRNFVNRFYAFAIPYVWIAKPEHQLVGIKLVIANSTHRTPSTCIDPTVKNFQWGDLNQGLHEAYDRDAFSAVLLDADGNVTEGPGFNVFAYYEGRLITPPDGILQGITRATVIELAEELGIPCSIEPMSADRLRAADEIFLTSTAGGVMPVTVLDGQTIADGEPGKVTMLVRELYWDAHDRSQWTAAVNYEQPALESIG